MKDKKEVFLTKEGLEELAAELDNLKQVVRPEVISQIKEARAQGDLSENAEYHSARDRQGHVEARIKELEYLIDNATIIEETTKRIIHTKKNKLTAKNLAKYKLILLLPVIILFLIVFLVKSLLI